MSQVMVVKQILMLMLMMMLMLMISQIILMMVMMQMMLMLIQMLMLMMSHLQRQIVCFIKVFCERVCVPGDGGEADLAEEKRSMLNQLGMESTAKSG